MMTDTQAIAATQMLLAYASFGFAVVSVCAWLGARRLKKKCDGAMAWCEFIKGQAEEEHNECVKARQIARINYKLCKLLKQALHSDISIFQKTMIEIEAGIEIKIQQLKADEENFKNIYRNEWSEAGEPVG